MTVEDIVKELNVETYGGKNGFMQVVTGAYASDLLSDVLINGQKGQIWITLHNHKNIVSIASLKEITAVIITQGIKPSEDAIKQSEVEGIPILGSSLKTFELAGLLYQILHKK